MSLTESQKEMLFNPWALSGRNRGMVLDDDAIPEADELVAHDWLEARPLENGDVAYFWTLQAETALRLGALTADAQDRQN